jgi:hypothetical protein
MKLDLYSEYFKNLLLRDVNIRVNNKIIRSGKIKNFAIKQFYIKLFIENNKGHVRMLELPYPFNIVQEGDLTSLNYNISTFCGANRELKCKLKFLSKKSVSKLYDTVVDITVV